MRDLQWLGIAEWLRESWEKDEAGGNADEYFGIFGENGKAGAG